MMIPVAEPFDRLKRQHLKPPNEDIEIDMSRSTRTKCGLRQMGSSLNTQWQVRTMFVSLTNFEKTTVMRILYALLFVCGFQLVSVAQTPTFKTAVEYNDYIITQQNRVLTAITDFNLSLDSGSIRYAHSKRDVIASVADDALLKLKKLPAYKGNTQFRAVTITLFEFYKSSAEVEYKEMIDLVMRPEKITNEIMKRINQLVDQVSDYEKKLDANFAEAQQKFATDNNFTLSGQ